MPSRTPALAEVRGNSSDLFRARMRLGDYASAFEMADALVLSGALGVSEVWNPWVNDREAPPQFWKKHLLRLLKTSIPSRLLIWKYFYLAALRSFLDPDNTLSRFAAISPGFTGNRVWMNFFPARQALFECDCSAAVSGLKKVRKLLPRDWFVRCTLGEALICSGRNAEGLREFGQAASGPMLGAVEAWKGEMLLMTGAYAGAVKSLKKAVSLRAAHSAGWLGAAYFKMGDAKKGGAWLARAAKDDPEDLETLVWLAELYRTSGRLRKAKEILLRVLKLRPNHLFARINLALLILAGGDEPRMMEIFAQIQGKLHEMTAGRRGFRPVKLPAPAEAQRIMLKVLAMAEGDRRDDEYLLRIRFPKLPRKR